MHWLIEGMNVLGSRRDRPVVRRRLVGQLAVFAAHDDGGVTVGFDGRGVRAEVETSPLIT